jgi:hypothetical protein
MKEINIHPEIIHALKECGCWAYKIPDMPFTGRATFCPPKPCDIISLYNGTTFYVEAKLMKKWEAFGERWLEESQIAKGKEIIDAGGKYFIFLNVRIKADSLKNVKQDNRLIIFRYQDVVGKPSIYAKDLINYPYISGHDKSFDLRSFLIDNVSMF